MQYYKNMKRILLLTCIIVQVRTECKEEEYLKNGKCIRRHQCMRRQIEIQNCTKTQDRMCNCPDEEYFDKEILSCQICKICGKNYRMTELCQREENTICLPCPWRHFSPGNNSVKCIEYKSGGSSNRMLWDLADCWTVLVSVCLIFNSQR